MTQPSGHWIWFLDQDAVESVLTLEPENSLFAKRATTHPSIVNAIRYHLEGKPEQALEALRPAADAKPPDSKVADVLLLAGQFAYELGRYEEAAEYYRRLAGIEPGHPYAAYNCGLALTRARRWKVAIEALQNAVLVAAGRAQAWFLLGVCLLQERRMVEAAAAFRQASQLRPDYAPAWFGEAVVLQHDGRTSEALEIYERLLAAKPDHREILQNALSASLVEENHERTTAYARRLRQLDPASATASYALFLAELGNRNLDNARTLLGQLSTASVTNWYNLGAGFVRANRREDAASAFATALGMDPDDPDALEGVARTGAAETAIPAWERLLKAHPERADGWFQLGLARYNGSQFAAAAEAFSRTVAIRPEWPEAWSNLAAAYRACGQLHQSMEAYSKALQLEPKLDNARIAMVYLALERNDLTTARLYYDPAVVTAAEIPAYLGYLAQQQGESGPAAAYYRDAVRLDPDSTAAFWNLGHILFSMNQIEEARDCWQKAIALDPRIAITSANGPALSYSS